MEDVDKAEGRRSHQKWTAHEIMPIATESEPGCRNCWSELRSTSRLAGLSEMVVEERGESCEVLGAVVAVD